jgi:hypothetical protein
MRDLISGLAAALTALLIGTVIAGAAESARVAEDANSQSQAAIATDTNTEQLTVDAGAYRTQLADARAQLSAAYADLQARDAAYRELLATSQANVERLQASNRQLQDQVVQSRLLLQQAQAQAARAATTTTRRRDDD